MFAKPTRICICTIARVNCSENKTAEHTENIHRHGIMLSNIKGYIYIYVSIVQLLLGVGNKDNAKRSWMYAFLVCPIISFHDFKVGSNH